MTEVAENPEDSPFPSITHEFSSPKMRGEREFGFRGEAAPVDQRLRGVVAHR